MKTKTYKLALLRCVEDLVIPFKKDENHEEVDAKCFSKGNEYLFCYEERSNELITINDVKEVHTMKLYSDLSNEIFDIVRIDDPETFDLSEFELARLNKLFRERLNYYED